MALLAAGLVAVPHLPLLLGRAELFYDDYRRFSVPMATVAAEALCEGRLPWWNAYAGVGQPLLTDPQSLSLYPGLALACVMPVSRALGTLVVMHLGLLAAGLTCLLRALGVHRAVAVGVGAAFALCGPAVSWMSSVPYLITLSFFPWVLLAAHRMAHAKRGQMPLLAVALGTGIGLATLGGDVPGALAQAATAAALALAAGGWRRTLPGIALAAGVAVVVGAASWAPLAWYVGRSVRAAGLTAAEAGRWSFHPAELVGLFVPNPLGLPLPDNTFWAFNWLRHPRLFVHSYYVGALLAAFGFTAATTVRRDRFLMAAALAALILFLLSTGATTPLWAVLQYAFKLARYPSKVAPIWLLLLAVLGGVALSRALDSPARGARAALAVAVVVLVGALALPLLQSQLARRVGAEPQQITTAAEQLRTGGVIAAILAGVAAAIFWLCDRHPESMRRRAPVLLAGVLVTDALVAGTQLWWTVPRALEAPPPTWIQPAPVPPRVVRAGELDEVRLHRDAIGYEREFMRQQRLLQPLTSLVHRIGIVEGYGLAPGDLSQRLAALYHRDPIALAESTAADVLLAAAGKGAGWVRPGHAAARIEIEAALPEGALVLRPTRAVPRAHTATGFTVVSRGQELSALVAGEHRRGPVVTDGEILEYGRAVPRPASDVLGNLSSRPGPIVPVSFAQWSPSRVRLVVERPQAALLVVADAFFEGWHASIDGHPAPLLRANGVGRAVVVPAGKHVVEMWFDLPLIRAIVVGSFIGLAAIVLAALGIVVARRGSERRS